MNATHFREHLAAVVKRAGSHQQLADRLHVDRALITRCLAGANPTPQLLAAMGWETRCVPCNEPPPELVVTVEQMAACRRLVAAFVGEPVEAASPVSL